jgi:hypothetical protein
MRTTRTLATAFAIIVGLSGSALAQSGLPSSKATAAVNTLVKCNLTSAVSGELPALITETCVNLLPAAPCPLTAAHGFRSCPSR